MLSKHINKYIILCEVQIRKVWYFSKERQQCLNRAAIKNDSGKIIAYKCEVCGIEVDKKTITVHHNNPHGHIDDSVKEYVLKMFVTPDELTCLCKDCHIKIHEELNQVES